jgi:hypothetical protein
MPTVQGYGGWKKGAPAADSSSLTEDRRKQAEYTEYLNTQSNINTGPLPTAPYGPVAVWRGPVPFGSTALQLGYAGGGPSRKSFSLGKIFSSGNGGLDLAGFARPQSPFTPLSIPGAILWLDGGDSSTITGTSPVTAWRDKSGNRNNASGSGGLSYTPGQGITFNGTNTFFSVPGVAGSVVGTPFTVFIVEKIAVLPPTGLAMGLFANNPNVGGQYTSFFTNYQDNGAITFGFYSADLTTSTTYSVGSTRILNFNYTGSNRTILVNGTSGGTQSWTQNLLPGAFTEPVIGKLWNTYYYNGTISEIILYIGNIDTQQYQQVEGYLAWKWGLQDQLPANHPYKKGPPV